MTALRFPRRAAAPAANAKAKSVIQIWMWGGPAHLDTFDPKPEAGNDYCGPLNKPIATNVSGIRICELLPLLAKQADKYSIIRSMTHGVYAHETASYTVQTGRMSGGRDVYPSVGAVVSLFKGYDAGYKGLIPPYIVLTEPQGRFSEAGFLGRATSPSPPAATRRKPSSRWKAWWRRASPTTARKRRRELLHKLNALAQAHAQQPELAATAKEMEDQAYELILGDAGKVFDLSQEKRTCATATAGTPSASPVWRPGAWSNAASPTSPSTTRAAGIPTNRTSRPCAAACRKWTKPWPRCCRIWPIAGCWIAPSSGGTANSAARQGRLGSALERRTRPLGRASSQPSSPAADSKAARCVGASDAKGEDVKERPVYPVDLIATIYQHLGIDRQAKLPHPMGLTTHAIPLPDEDKDVKFNGILKELV